MIDVGNASVYFASHPMGSNWAEYSTEQRTGAIEYAKRELSRALGRPMKEDAEPDEAQPTAHTMASGKDHFAAEAMRWLGGSVRVETVLG